MPEEKVEYEVEQEPELICPLRMIAADITEGSNNPTYPECIREQCAWWTYNAYGDKCALAAIAEYGLGVLRA